MPISPSMAGIVTISTSSEYALASGVTISNLKVLAMLLSETKPLSQCNHLTMQLGICSALFNFFNAALHVKVAFGNIIVLAFENFFEAANGFRNRDLFPLTSGEDLCNAERLAEEPLNLARTENG